jgi:hypothetical protein
MGAEIPTVADRLAEVQDLVDLPHRGRRLHVTLHGATWDELIAFGMSAKNREWKVEAKQSADGSARWVQAEDPESMNEVTVFLGITEDVPSLPPTFVQIIERRLGELRYIEVAS